MSEFEQLTVAISPCPNDTFAFYHFLLDDKSLDAPPLGGVQASHHLEYKPVFLDIEELNLGMMESKWDIVKASFTVGLKHRDYELLPSGSAIGFGVGPIAVFADNDIVNKQNWIVGLPGENTTANFLWNYFLNTRPKNIPDKDMIVSMYMNFSQIMNKISDGELDMGVLIHEGRFIYQNHNLRLYLDLGEFWQNNTGFPVPLGGIFIKKSLSEAVKAEVKKDLKSSVETALLQKKENNNVYLEQLIPYIKKYSQESSQKVIEQHIETYVTKDTVMLSDRAIEAIEYFKSILKIV
jgi:1,4-dihydroxy-6-naphthoate synthase